MQEKSLSRRDLLSATAFGAVAVAVPATTHAQRSAGADGFDYEVQRSQEEWRTLLSEEEFAILREGDTELPKSSPNWNRDEPGTYACRGCELPIYDSEWKRPVAIGWAFFQFSKDNSVLMGIDQFGPPGDDGAPPDMIEAHCRRCGSHLGHIVQIDGVVLHCINGKSIAFERAQA